MPKAKTEKPKKLKKTTAEVADVIELEDDGEVVEVTHTELEPDILAALESKRSKKKSPTDIDYIPELERDLEGASFDDDF